MNEAEDEGGATIEEWGVRSDAGGSGTATYGPYSTREAAEEVRDRLVEGGGWFITRRVTEWTRVIPPVVAENDALREALARALERMGIPRDSRIEWRDPAPITSASGSNRVPRHSARRAPHHTPQGHTMTHTEGRLTEAERETLDRWEIEWFDVGIGPQVREDLCAVVAALIAPYAEALARARAEGAADALREAAQDMRHDDPLVPEGWLLMRADRAARAAAALAPTTTEEGR